MYICHHSHKFIISQPMTLLLLNLSTFDDTNQCCYNDMIDKSFWPLRRDTHKILRLVYVIMMVTGKNVTMLKNNVPERSGGRLLVASFSCRVRHAVVNTRLMDMEHVSFTDDIQFTECSNFLINAMNSNQQRVVYLRRNALIGWHDDNLVNNTGNSVLSFAMNDYILLLHEMLDAKYILLTTAHQNAKTTRTYFPFLDIYLDYD